MSNRHRCTLYHDNREVVEARFDSRNDEVCEDYKRMQVCAVRYKQVKSKLFSSSPTCVC